MTLRHVMPYVEPRPSALNVTLPVFAAERGRLLQISIDSCWYAAPADACASAQQQTSRTPLPLSIDGTDDGHRQLHRRIQCEQRQ